MSNTLRKAMLECSALIQENISEILPKDFPDSKIVEAMLYSNLSGGKKIRPFLLMSCAGIFGVPTAKSINTATAIELIHTYSLIHDDLPAMDDDDFRRGQPSSHKKFDEATAILAGDALLTFAFEILSEAKTHQDPAIRCELIKTLALSSGYKGMIGGQMIDLENSENKLSKEQIANLHRQKTGELFMASCEMGAIIGKASKEDRQKLRYYAHDLGLAFQIRDDILDHKGFESQKTNIDAISNSNKEDNASIVDVIGFEAATKQLELLIDQAKSHVAYFGEKASILVHLADFIEQGQY